MVKDLTHLSHNDLLDLFARLPCPTSEEMVGEFSARVLAGQNSVVSLITDLSVNNPILGFWVGKAFSGSGQGHNYFRRFGRIVRSQPMVTRIGPSRFDGRPCFQLHYGAFFSACGLANMADEVRKVDAGLYLGMGTVGYTRWKRSIRRPFQLTGPNSAYVGDIHSLRNPFFQEKSIED